MRGYVTIWQICTKMNDYDLVDAEVSFTIDYEDGQTISTKVIFSKHNYRYEDIMTCIQKYFKGDLQYGR